MEIILLKLTFIRGLKETVLEELSTYPVKHVVETKEDAIYIETNEVNAFLSMRSVINIYLLERSSKITPRYISQHKSILGKLIEKILNGDFIFKTFKISCAGSKSEEVKSIKKFIAGTFKLIESDEADLEIYIGKVNSIWECGVRLTPRPLSFRAYKKENIKGALNPTIAYAMNTFCDLKQIHSYLNVFSGSATLLIEAGISNPNLKLVGFDIEGKRNAAAVKNIKAAKLIKNIRIQTADIFAKPNFGKFDCITSDLPFGMQIGDEAELPQLHEAFLTYCKQSLEQNGKLVVYTAQYKLFEEIILLSAFKVDNILELTLPTTVSTHTYLHLKIFVCSFR